MNLEEIKERFRINYNCMRSYADIADDYEWLINRVEELEATLRLIENLSRDLISRTMANNALNPEEKSKGLGTTKIIKGGGFE